MNLRHLHFLALSVLLLVGNAAWADGPTAHLGTTIPFSGDNIIVGDKARLVSKKNETGAVPSQPYVFRIAPDTAIDLSIEHPKGVFAYLIERDDKSPINDEEKQTQEIATQFSLTIAQLDALNSAQSSSDALLLSRLQTLYPRQNTIEVANLASSTQMISAYDALLPLYSADLSEAYTQAQADATKLLTAAPTLHFTFLVQKKGDTSAGQSAQKKGDDAAQEVGTGKVGPTQGTSGPQERTFIVLNKQRYDAYEDFLRLRKDMTASKQRLAYVKSNLKYQYLSLCRRITSNTTLISAFADAPNQSNALAAVRREIWHYSQRHHDAKVDALAGACAALQSGISPIEEEPCPPLPTVAPTPTAEAAFATYVALRDGVPGWQQASLGWKKTQGGGADQQVILASGEMQRASDFIHQHRYDYFQYPFYPALVTFDHSFRPWLGVYEAQTQDNLNELETLRDAFLALGDRMAVIDRLALTLDASTPPTGGEKPVVVVCGSTAVGTQNNLEEGFKTDETPVHFQFTSADLGFQDGDSVTATAAIANRGDALTPKMDAVTPTMEFDVRQGTPVFDARQLVRVAAQNPAPAFVGRVESKPSASFIETLEAHPFPTHKHYGLGLSTLFGNTGAGGTTISSSDINFGITGMEDTSGLQIGFGLTQRRKGLIYFSLKSDVLSKVLGVGSK